jgi:type IV pilus assembly protein PilC
VERGTSFADAVARHTRVFPAFYRAMLRSADFTGNLNEVLNQAGVYLERDIAARQQIKSALTYPIVVVCVAIVAVILMAAFVLPKFADLYKSVNAKLPLPTRMLLGVTDFFNNYWWAIFLGLAGAGALTMAILGGSANKHRRDGLFWNAPGLSSLVRSVCVERFCRVLAALTRAGVPLTESLEVAAKSTNSSIFAGRMESVREDIVRGSGLSDSMRKTELFPNTAQQMIDVGERTGGLSNQLGRAAVYYEREVSQRIKRLTDLFEPLVILFIGLVVGFVAIAQVAAMYSVFSQIK